MQTHSHFRTLSPHAMCTYNLCNHKSELVQSSPKHKHAPVPWDGQSAFTQKMGVFSNGSTDPGCPGGQGLQNHAVFRQFKGKPYFEQIWAQGPPFGVKTLLGPWPKSWIHAWFFWQQSDSTHIWGLCRITPEALIYICSHRSGLHVTEKSPEFSIARFNKRCVISPSGPPPGWNPGSASVPNPALNYACLYWSRVGNDGPITPAPRANHRHFRSFVMARTKPRVSVITDTDLREATVKCCHAFFSGVGFLRAQVASR